MKRIIKLIVIICICLSDPAIAGPGGEIRSGPVPSGGSSGSGSSGSATIKVEEGNSSVLDTVETLDFNANDFNAVQDGTDNETDISIPSGITRDIEWDTASEINNATTDTDFLTENICTSDNATIKRVSGVYVCRDWPSVDVLAGKQIDCTLSGDNMTMVYDNTTDTWLCQTAISSVFGRYGAVTPQSGDYQCSEVTDCVPSAYDSISDLPTAAVTDGDTTHIATADAIFDFCETTQNYLKPSDIQDTDNVTLTGGSIDFDSGDTLGFPTETTCAQTGEGLTCWDTDGDFLTVGTGTDRKYIVDLPSLPVDNGYVVAYNTATGEFYMKVDATGSGGSPVVFDIGDDGGNDSADITEIATTGDTNAIFTEPTADKIQIDLTKDWPKADVADSANDLSCTTCISTGEIEDNATTGIKIADGTIPQTKLAFDPATQSELTTAIAGKDACSEITGCIESAITSAGVTYENLNANGDVGTGSTQVAVGNHTHSGYESSTSNDFDPDRLAGDTTDDNLIDDGIIASTVARDSEVTTAVAAKDECSEITNCVPNAYDAVSDFSAAVGDADTTHVPTSNDVFDFCETTQDYLKTSENSDSSDDLTNNNIADLADVTAKSGNTTVIATISGTLTNGNCVEIDASGNLVDAGAVCGAGGSGDITAVGPGCSTGACFTDDLATTGTTMFVWEGTTVDGIELNIIGPADPATTDIDITMPAASGTLATNEAVTYYCETTQNYIKPSEIDTVSELNAIITDGDFSVTTHAHSGTYEPVDSTISRFSSSIDDTEMSAEDFGDFTCTGAEDGCTVDSGAVTCAEVSDCVPNAYDAITDIQDGSTTQKGVVQLATDGESTAGEVVNSNDSRLSNARTPSAHAATHVNGTDDIQSATAAQKGLATAAQITKLDGIEAGADVTDSTNVDAAGATMNADTDVSGNSWVLDEDAMGSNSAVKVPTQQSVKAYVDANAGKVTTYADVATAEAVDPADNDICYVVATESYYRAETTGSAYTDDNTYVLDTAGVTDERWLAISGKYNYEDVAMYVPRIVYSNASDSSGNPFIPELAYTEADGSTASFTLGQYTVFDTPLVRVPSVGDVSLLGSYRNAYATPFDGGSGGGTTFSTTYHSGFWTTTIIESATANLYTSGNSAWYKGYCPQSITDSVKIFLNTPPMAARISGQGVSLYVKFKLPATGGAGSYGQAVFGLTEATSGEDDQLSFGCRYKELTTDATTYTKFMVESYDSGAHKYRDATVVLGDGAWHTLVVDVKDTAWYAYLDNPNRTGGTGAASFSSAAQTSVTINDIDTWAAVFPYIEVYGGYQTLTAGTAYATQIEVEELFVTYGGSAF